jgi:hypothetical protein
LRKVFLGAAFLIPSLLDPVLFPVTFLTWLRALFLGAVTFCAAFFGLVRLARFADAFGRSFLSFSFRGGFLAMQHTVRVITEDVDGRDRPGHDNSEDRY